MTGLKALDPFTGVETLTAKGLSALAAAIGKAWDGLSADHAKAAAGGPQAEARQKIIGVGQESGPRRL